MIYIGIDNGISGALVALSDHPGPAIAMTPMPVKSKGQGSGKEVDALALWLWIYEHGGPGCHVILETPGKHSPGVLALCSMWDCYGVIRGVLEARRVRHHRIMPQAWQKIMLPNCPKGETKPAARARACQLWPYETWLATEKSTKPNEGLIDAALLAEYGRIHKL